MKVILLPLVLLISLFVLIMGGLAGINHNTYIVGGAYVVREGEIVHGNLEFLFAQVALEKDSRVEGAIVSISSVVDVRGTVTGNISSLESDIILGQSAHVKAVPRDTGVFPLVILLPEMARWNLGIGQQAPRIPQ